MGKYVPSGYQIIALPEISGNSISWNMGDDVPEEIQRLYEFISNGGYKKKPLLITCKISGQIITGFIPLYFGDDQVTVTGEISITENSLRFNIDFDLTSKDVTISLNTIN